MSKKNNLDIDYDKKHDVLYISLGEPKPSYSSEILPGVFLRRDFGTDEITGVTILNFATQFKSNSLEFNFIPIELNKQKLQELLY